MGVDKPEDPCHNTFMSEKVFTVAEIAECLGVGTRYVRKLAHRNRVGDRHGPTGMYTFSASDFYVMRDRRAKWRRSEQGEKDIPE